MLKTALKAIARVINLLRPIRVRRFDALVVYLKHLSCTSVTGDISVTRGDRNRKRIDIYLSSRAPNGRNVIWKRSGVERAEEDMGAIRDDSLSVLQGNMEIIQEQIPGIKVAIVDLNGDRWTMLFNRWVKEI